MPIQNAINHHIAKMSLTSRPKPHTTIFLLVNINLTQAYHWFVRVFLELYKAHTGDVFQVVPVLRLKVIVVAVEVGQGRWCDSHRLLPVYLVCHHIVCLQQ